MTRYLVAVTLLWSLLAVAHADAPAVKEVPADLVFWTEGCAARDMRHGIDWRWPSAEGIEAKAPKDPAAAKEAKEEAELWLRLLMNEDLVPDDVKARMVLLDEDQDRIVARYVVGDLAIYWQQTKGGFVTVARKASPEQAAGEGSMRRLVQEIAERLFVGQAGPVSSLSVPEAHFHSTPYGAWGLVTAGDVAYQAPSGPQSRVERRGDEDLPPPFQRPLVAKTDGQTVHFDVLPKILDQGRWLGTRNAISYVLRPGERVISNWFSSDAAPEPAH